MVDAVHAAVVEALFDGAWNRQQFDELRQAVPGELTFHYRGASFTTSVDELEVLVDHWRAAFPDLRMEVLSQVGEGDLVAVRLRYAGTHRGAWHGTAPTGRRIEVDEMVFLRFEGRRLVELWEVQDELGLLAQIGAVEMPGS